MPGIFISLMDEINIVSWSSDQVGEGKSMCLRWFRSLRRTSYQDAVGLNGEPIEFEWTYFPGFSSLSLLREIQNDLETKNIKPETSRTE